MAPGFRKIDLTPRYNVRGIREDAWHSFSESRTNGLIERRLTEIRLNPGRLLNAGCGGSSISVSQGDEIRMDLFLPPLAGSAIAVCGSVTQMPFADNSFGCVICVGEVLGYCDPASALAEFSRVLAPSGTLICDFGSSVSIRHRFTPSFGRAADMIVDSYNGSPENIWIYNPAYVKSLLSDLGFAIDEIMTTHSWSALARCAGMSAAVALEFEKTLGWIRLPSKWADLTTIVAVRERAGSQ